MNPSEQIAANLAGTHIESHQIRSVVLPVTFERAFRVLADAISFERPALIVCLGQAGGRDAICVERVAINVCDAAIPDNSGHQPRDVAIEPGGPVGYWSSLPTNSIVAALRRDGVRAAVSNSAGTFVCNQVFYRLMSVLSDNSEIQGGFIHVPFLPEQAAAKNSPSMPLSEMERGIRIAIATSLNARLSSR